ncbi:MAG: GH3 auxin-responsive promoter family protein [Dysgonamonadaceae bacterium]|jgi:hypothetical protein|nr:GH3 auxin-responsive promoter family protein [Dysgonamonadaceae bacterium]
MILDKSALILFKSRLKSIERFEKHPDIVQSEQFNNLIKTAQNTEWGKMYDYASIRSYEDFASRVPLQNYENIKPFVERITKGENNILWPEKIRWMAKSSGTTDKSKFIPVSESSLHECHYKGGKDTVATYLNNKSDSRLFSGKGLILGGSYKPTAYNQHVVAGDLSAVLINNMHPLANFFRTPSKKIILMDEWETKLEAICQSTINENVTNLSGVPSWFMVLIKNILERSGKQYLTEVWPNLEVFFHGGISFTPYREQYQALIPSPRMCYMETYNASEGFFGIQNDLSDSTLLLMLDYGIFYEFIPLEEIGSDNPKTYRLQDVELNKNYALVMTSNNGLWRYIIGDTVMFKNKSPYKFIITGRTHHFINAFGEELMVSNADKALHRACMESKCKIKEYTAAPVYMSSENKGRHQWIIEFEEEPVSLTEFTTVLDKTLQSLNSDYEAKRYKNITLDMPLITVARKNLFYDWLKERGKLGGQNKIPRLSNNREYMDILLILNN